MTPDEQTPWDGYESEQEWLEGLRYKDKFACACRATCGDVPEEQDPSGVCKGLPRG